MRNPDDAEAVSLRRFRIFHFPDFEHFHRFELVIPFSGAK